jgi:hypothetical protein
MKYESAWRCRSWENCARPARPTPPSRSSRITRGLCKDQNLLRWLTTPKIRLVRARTCLERVDILPRQLTA